MDADEIVLHRMECDRGGVVLDFLCKRIRQPREAAHVDSHCEVAARPLD